MRIVFTLFMVPLFLHIYSQPTYIAMTGNNNGSGNNNLFANCLNTGHNAYIDWEVYVDGATCGGTSSTGSGQGSKCRVILRNSTVNSEPTSVVASEGTIITGMYNGDSGNNDKYYVNLASNISTPGFYTVEIQCTCNDGNYDADSRTTWTYDSPTAYWNGGTSDPINHDGGGNMLLINNYNGQNGSSFLGYFTVGNVDMYRSMIVFNDRYYDLLRFTPGNPPAPSSIQSGVGTTPAALGTVCGSTSITPPTLKIGAETNVFKRSCADVTGCQTFYRVYKNGTTPPSFTSFNISWKDNCDGGYNATTGSIAVFGNPDDGGSCYSGATTGTYNNYLGSCIESQRWQTKVGNTNILPTSFSPSDVGLWNIDYYNSCSMNNCSGTIVETDPANAPASFYTATFNVTATQSTNPSNPCYLAPAPVVFLDFTVTKANKASLITWTTASETNNEGFDIERSTDGLSWEVIGFKKGHGNVSREIHYKWTDNNPKPGTNYYRLNQRDFDGGSSRTETRKVRFSALNKSEVHPNPTTGSVTLTVDESCDIRVYDASGRMVANKKGEAGTNELDLTPFAPGIYTLRLMNEAEARTIRVVKN